MSVRPAIYVSLLFVAALLGVIRYKRLSFPYKLLAWSAIMTFFVYLFDRYCIAKYRTNAPAEHIQGIGEYIFYSLCYYNLFKNEMIKKVIILSLVILAFFFPINAIFLQPFFTTFPTNIYTPAQTLYTAFSLLLFKEMLNYPLGVVIIRQSVFWFNTAMLFYGTTSFFLLGLTNYISKLPDDDFIYLVWWGILYIFVIFICIALLTNSRENNRIESRR